jgi:hypothetical protein
MVSRDKTSLVRPQQILNFSEEFRQPKPKRSENTGLNSVASSREHRTISRSFVDDISENKWIPHHFPCLTAAAERGRGLAGGWPPIGGHVTRPRTNQRPQRSCSGDASDGPGPPTGPFFFTSTPPPVAIWTQCGNCAEQTTRLDAGRELNSGENSL